MPSPPASEADSMRRCALAASARSSPSCAASSRTARAATPATAALQHILLGCLLEGVVSPRPAELADWRQVMLPQQASARDGQLLAQR